jgi:hypothetical protein
LDLFYHDISTPIVGEQYHEAHTPHMCMMSVARASSNPKGAKTMDVNTLLHDLRIGEEDFDDLIIGEEMSIDEEPDLLPVA